MRIAIGSDHNGFELKKILHEYILSSNHECEDLGTYSQDPINYPDIALKVALDISKGKYERGILICGTGIGMAIAANKVPGIFAAQVDNIYQAERAIKSNNAQILTLGALIVSPELAKRFLDVWLKAEFKDGRSTPKIERIKEIDRNYRSLK